MVNQVRKHSQKMLRKGYWAIVGMISVLIISLQPVMADTIWDRFSSIMRDV